MNFPRQTQQGRSTTPCRRPLEQLERAGTQAGFRWIATRKDLPVVQEVAGTRCADLRGVDPPVLAERSCEYPREGVLWGTAGNRATLPVWRLSCNAMWLRVPPDWGPHRSGLRTGAVASNLRRPGRPDAVSALELDGGCSQSRPGARLRGDFPTGPAGAPSQRLALVGRVLVVALVCVLGAATPLLVGRGLGFAS